MKTIVTTFALSLALCAAAGATAQTRSAAPASAPDSVLLSETTDGDYLVRKYVVNRVDDNGYSIRYQINTAKLVSTLNGNSKELKQINGFVENLMNDTLMHVKSVKITGYSSPDGPVKFNETLAKNRAADFKNYVDKKYGFSKKFKVSTSSVAEDWEMCRALVAQSNIPDKQAVLKVIDGSGSPEAKEQKLKEMTAAWDYMKANILPPLRRVELTINYGAGTVVEQRMMIKKPQPQPQPEPKTVCEEAMPCTVVDESITGIIVELPDPDVDYTMGDQSARMMNREARDMDQMAKREARAADKIAKEDVRAAKKIAKKEAKAAKKAEKAARKTVKETEKALR